MNKKAFVAAIATLAVAVPAVATLPANAAPTGSPTPTATETAKPTRSTLKVAMAQPSDPTQPVVLRISGLKPGANVDAVSVLAARINKGPYAAGTNGIADAEGRLTLTLNPFDGKWVTGKSYLVFVNAQTQWTGTFALPGDTSTEAPAPKKPTDAPKKSTKPPVAKERTGGLAQTGV